jgi:hypothetical protein
MITSYKHLSRRMMSVWISHLFNPMFERCLADQEGKDIYAFGCSILKPNL